MSKSLSFQRGYHRVAPSGSLTRGDLISRGWTDTAIAKFLGKPDSITGGKLQYTTCHRYAKGRVDEAEKTEEFKLWMEKITERRKKLAGTREVATQKRLATLQRNRDALVADVEQSLASLVLDLPPATSYESIRDWVGSQNKGFMYISAERVASALRTQVLAQALPLVTRIRDVERRNTIIRDYVRDQIKHRYGHIEELAEVIQD